MQLRFPSPLITALLLIAACAGRVCAQAAPGGHLGHHPAPGDAATPPVADPAAATPPAPPAGGVAMPGNAPGNPPGAAPAGGMGGGMDDMMKQMGTPPPKELYPTLMAFPDGVTREERARIDQLAQDRMKEGSALLSSGLGKLSDATSSQDYPAMQDAAEQMREGLARFQTGLAARRVLAEGTAPRNLALDWFKREMNLALPSSAEPRTFLGVTPFHLFTMALLTSFGLSIVAMYFFKMRRAAALFGRLGPDANPAPGSAPELAGKTRPPPPSRPVGPDAA